MPEHMKGKRGRKIGRNKRKPCKKRYTSERRWITNKAKKIVKYMRFHPTWSPSNLSLEVREKVCSLGAKHGIKVNSGGN